MSRFQIYVCDGPSCGVTHDSERLVDQIEDAIEKDPTLCEKAGVERFTCFDHCDDGPNLFVRNVADGEQVEEPDSEVFCAQRGFYSHMSQEKVKRVLEQHVKEGTPVEDLVTDY